MQYLSEHSIKKIFFNDFPQSFPRKMKNLNAGGCIANKEKRRTRTKRVCEMFKDGKKRMLLDFFACICSNLIFLNIFRLHYFFGSRFFSHSMLIF
jgi:hypothetical protein